TCPCSAFFRVLPRPPATLFPYTTLFRSAVRIPGPRRDSSSPPGCRHAACSDRGSNRAGRSRRPSNGSCHRKADRSKAPERKPGRSEEHTSELQSRVDLVCRLLLEKKKNH